MKAKTVFVTALVASVLSSGAALAGKGHGAGGMGMGAQDGSMQRAMPQGQRKAGEQDRDREQYRGPDAERDTQKAKARQFGQQAGGAGEE